MKFFILFALVAAAYAESEAEADPYLLYSGYAAGYHPYTSGYYPYAHTYSTAYTYPYATYGHVLGKREAEADADPALVYSAYHPYTTAGYYPYSHAFGYRAAYSYPYTTYAHHVLGKREAEAEPEPYYPYTLGYTPYAHAYTPYAHHVYPTHYRHAVTGATVANDAVSPFGYAAKGQYAAVTAGSAHFAKREAEADPAVVYSHGYYPYASTYAHPFAHTYRAAYSYPYTTYGRYFF